MVHNVIHRGGGRAGAPGVFGLGAGPDVAALPGPRAGGVQFEPFGAGEPVLAGPDPYEPASRDQNLFGFCTVVTLKPVLVASLVQ